MGVWTTRALAALGLVALVATSVGCGDDGDAAPAVSKVDAAEETSESTLPPPLVRSSSTTAATGDVGDVNAGGIDPDTMPTFSFTTGTGTDPSVVVVTAGKAKIVEIDGDVAPLVSPDGEHIAVSRRADAVRGARLVLVDSATGKEAQAFDLDAEDVEAVSWAPDSSAVAAIVTPTRSSGDRASIVVHRVDGTTATAAANENTSRQAAIDSPKWVAGADGMTWGTGCTLPNRPDAVCDQAQLITSKGQPVVLVRGDGVFGRWDPAAGNIVGLVDQASVTARPCGRFAVLTVGQDTLLYDADSGATSQPIGQSGSPGCDNLVPSPSGKRVAVRTRAEPIVVDIAGGTITTIAREGMPIAWSKDESSILVETTTATFLVAADGSGGQETSIRLRDICPGGAAGKVVARGEEPSVVVYDLASDSATEIPDAELSGSSCTTTADGLWSNVGTRIYSIAQARSAIVNVRVGATETTYGTPMWHVPSVTWNLRR